MLQEIHIADFALIDQLDLEFKQGLHAFTGETGSGKSIIIDALSFTLGRRTDRSFVRQGSMKARIEAIFISEKENERLSALLSQVGITYDGTAVLCREIFESGKSISRINSKIVPTNFLKQVGSHLITIHGQNEFIEVLRSTSQLTILDQSFDLENTLPMRKYEALFQEYQALQATLKSLLRDTDPVLAAREADIVSYQIKEIHDIRLQENEDQELEKKIQLMENAKDIAGAVTTGYGLLYENPENILESLNHIIRSFDKYKSLDGFFAQINALLQDSYYKLEDVAFSLRDARSAYQFDEQALEQHQERYSKIQRLFQKYGRDYQEVKAYYKSLQDRFKHLENAQQLSEQAQEKLQDLIRQMKREAVSITKLRKEAALSLSQVLEAELHSLGLEQAGFSIAFTESENFLSTGKDQIEFEVSFNSGEPLKPFHKVSSGGEISRFMLALKNISASAEEVESLIFDEIDTGISGLAAEKVGRKLKQISLQKQVIIITHLPQIAAKADHHYLVEKQLRQERMLTCVRNLSLQQRVQEIAQMFSGSRVTDSSVRYAQELLQNAAREGVAHD